MYREDKATQMAASLLRQAGSRMPFLKLMKELYLADRRMLVEYGMPITYDNWCSMRFGPVLSQTYDRMKDTASEWSKYIRIEGYDAVLVNDPGDGALSVAENRIIKNVFCELVDADQWQAADFTHTLAEWENPGNSSKPLPFDKVLEVEGFSQADIESIMSNIRFQDDVERIFKAV